MLIVNARLNAAPGAGLLLAVTLALVPLTASGQSGQLLSAFFGLDNGLPLGANGICLGASGQDGMPVVLSHTVDPQSLQSEDFQVVTRSGAVGTPHCVTLRPAQDPGEQRTVLLIGEFGDAPEDPPMSVLIVGDLLAEDGSVNFRGLETDVIPLDAGPSLVLAEVVPMTELPTETRGSACPGSTAQVVRVTWTGGVRLPNRDEVGDTERRLYRVEIEHAAGAEDIVPAALADLGDRDNNHLLCLDTVAPAVAVSFPAGQLVDPNGDLNPATQVAVKR